MSRTSRRRALRAVAPVAGLLAAGLLVWQGSYAAFSSTTTNQQDAWATGNLLLKNNGGAGTVYSATTTTPLISSTNLVPGSTATKCITVDSSGSIAGGLKFYRGGITDVTNATFPTAFLSAKVNLVVDAAVLTAGQTVDATCAVGTGIVAFPGTSTAVYTGTLAGLQTSYAAAPVSIPVAAGAQRIAYRIAWTVDPTTDNTFQGASTKADLNWEIQ
jgi:hypothetical protein